MYDKILALIQANGPSLPVEIASKTNLNSFLAKAYLTELVDQGKLKAGERIGSTNMFFLPGQEALATQRAQELLSATRTVATHTGKDLDMSPEAVARREHFKRHFEKTLSEPEKPKEKTTMRPTKTAPTSTPVSSSSKLAQHPEAAANKRVEDSPESAELTGADKWASTRELDQKFKTTPQAISSPTPTLADSLASKLSKTKGFGASQKPQVFDTSAAQPSKPAETIARRITKLFTPPKTATKLKTKPASGAYIANVKNMFYSGQSKVVEEIGAKKKQGKFVVDFPSSIGAIRYFVTVIDKKSINKSDIALAYTEAANRRLPALLVTNGKLASTAKSYADDLGGMFRFKTVK